MKFSFRELTVSSLTDLALPLAVVAGFIIVGTYLLVDSNADTLTPSFAQYLTVSARNANNVLSRGNPKNTPNGYIFGPGLTITGVQLTSFELYANTPSQGVGFYTVSGGLGAGQTDTIQTYVNPNKPNGVYTGNYTLKYYVSSTHQWLSGPVISYRIKLVNHSYTDYLTVSNLSTTVTLSKSQASPHSGLVLADEPSITALQNSGFEVVYNQPTQGKGFYISSGGIQTGQTVDLQAYISTGEPDGTYTGTAALKYLNSSNQWVDGPTLTYSITLTN
jgi:hypothetical protein